MLVNSELAIAGDHSWDREAFSGSWARKHRTGFSRIYQDQECRDRILKNLPGPGMSGQGSQEFARTRNVRTGFSRNSQDQECGDRILNNLPEPGMTGQDS